MHTSCMLYQFGFGECNALQSLQQETRKARSGRDFKHFKLQSFVFTQTEGICRSKFVFGRSPSMAQKQTPTSQLNEADFIDWSSTVLCFLFRDSDAFLDVDPIKSLSY
jgi:hypothetical protein